MNESKSEHRRAKRHKKAQTRLSRAEQRIDNIRSIDVVEFANARSAELNVLVGLAQGSCNRRVFQQLPRHLRRRAMSHNVHRLPARLRKRAIDEVAKMERQQTQSDGTSAAAAAHRCVRRRPVNVLAQQEKRRRKHRWLETHLWHAKRMHMMNIWGYRLARNCADKGVRTRFKAALHLCTVHDKSYVVCMELTAYSQSTIVEVLAHCLHPIGAAQLEGEYLSRGQRSVSTVMYFADQIPFGAIAPVSLMWKPSNSGDTDATDVMDATDAVGGAAENPAGGSTSLWLWVHAAALHDVKRALTESIASVRCSGDSNDNDTVHMTDRSHELLRFELMGSKSNSVLGQVLRPVAGDGSVATRLLTSIATHRSADSLPGGVVLGITVQSPTLFRCKQSFVSSASPKQESDGAILSWPDKETIVCESSLWDASFRARLVAFGKSMYIPSPVRRLRKRQKRLAEAHRRKQHQRVDVDVDVDADVDADAKAAPQNADKNSSVAKQECDEDSFIERDSMTDLGSVDCVSVVIVQRPGLSARGIGSGWDVIVPAGWGRAFWLNFVYAGARAIGFDDRRSIRSEMGAMTFPQDYPDTSAGSAWEEMVSAEAQHMYDARPPAKRPNFAKMAVIRPFVCDWAALVARNDSQHVAICRNAAVVHWLRRAVCSDGDGNLRTVAPVPDVASMIVPVTVHLERGTPKDFAHICAPTPEDVVRYVRLDEPVHKGRTKAKRTTVQTPVRPVIGRITRGAFSILEGRGSGFGFVGAQDLYDTFRVTGTPLVWVRNTSSHKYNWATVRIIDPRSCVCD